MLSYSSRITFPVRSVRFAPTPRRYRSSRLANVSKYCTNSPPFYPPLSTTQPQTQRLSIGPQITVQGRGFLYLARDSPRLSFGIGVSSPLSCSNRSFSTTTANMVGTKIDGTSIAKSIREKLNGEIHKAQTSNPRFKPSLVIFQGKYLLLTHRYLLPHTKINANSTLYSRR